MREESDAHRRRDRQVAALGVDRQLDRAQQLVRDLGDVVARRVVQQHDELVAAEARHHVARAQACGDARGHGLQQAVADEVPQRIVDALEVVEVDEQQRQRRVGRARPLDLPAQPFHERHAVRQAGERVVVREVMDARLRGVAVAQVAHHRHAQLLVAIDQRAPDQLHRDALAVLADDGALVGEILPAVEHALHVRALVGRDEVDRPAAAHLLQRIAQHLAQRRVGVGDDAVAVERDALGAGLHELREPLLGLAQRLRGEVVSGDVGDDDERAHRMAHRRDVGDDVDLDPAARAVGRRQLPHVGDGAALAGDRVDRRLDLARRGLADDLDEGLADDGGLGEPEGAGVRLVGEAAAVAQLLGIVIGDHRLQAVREQAERLQAAVPGSDSEFVGHAAILGAQSRAAQP